MKNTNYINLLKEILSIESKSGDSVGINKVDNILVKKLLKSGFNVKVYKKKNLPYQYVLKTKIWNNKLDKLLISGHTDTVLGLKEVEISENKDWIYGPGANDMKGGLISLIYAIEKLYKENKNNIENIIITLTTDEEKGSTSYKKVLKRYYKMAKFALILEGVGENYELCSRRRGIAILNIKTIGKAGHSGRFSQIYPNALVELSYQVLKIVSLSNKNLGLTINLGKMNGGMAVNTVAEYAEATLDIRFKEQSQFKEVERKIYKLIKNKKQKLSKVKIEIENIFPAMIENKNTIIFKQIIKDAFTNLNKSPKFLNRESASDGNILSSLGVGSIDGLGTFGYDIHTNKERVLKESIYTSGENIIAILRSFFNYNNL